MSKERNRLSKESLERLLQLYGSKSLESQNFDHAIQLFLTEYPDGSVRKRPRHLNGHNYPTQRKGLGRSINEPSLERIKELLKQGEPIELIDPEDIPISDESSDESDFE